MPRTNFESRLNEEERKMRKVLLLAGAVVGMAWSFTAVASSTRYLPMDDAALMMSVELGNIREAPIYKKLEAVSGAAPGPVSRLAEARRLVESCGMKLEQMKSVFVAVAKFGDNGSADFIFGVTLEEALPPEAVEKLNSYSGAIMLLFKGLGPGETWTSSIAREKYGGFKLVKLIRPAGEVFCLTLADEGKLLVGGSIGAVKGALDRIKSGKMSAATGKFVALRKSAFPDTQLRLSVSFPASLRAKIKEAADSNAKQNPMLGDSFKSFGALASATAGLKFGDNLDVALNAGFGDAQSAQAAGAFVNQMLFPMLKVSLPTNGKPMDCLETFSAAVVPGSNDLKLKLTFTPKDLSSMRALASAAAPREGGRAMPVAAGGGKHIVPDKKRAQ